MSKLNGIFTAIIILAFVPFHDASGRGFGGGFGGFREGGFSADRFSGFSAGGFDRSGFGGYRSGGYDASGVSGFRGRSFDDSQFRGGDLRSADGFHAGDVSGFHADGAGAFRADSFHAWHDVQGPAGASRTQLDKFLGLPTDAGMSHVSAAHVGGAFEGTRVTAGHVEGPRGGEASFVSATHVGYVSPDVRNAQALSVRRQFNGYHLFTPQWWTGHRAAWFSAGLAASAWTAATWDGASSWIGCDSTPEDYNYGDTVVYTGGNVYVEGQPAGSYSQYYDQANTLASGGAAKQEDNAQWLPLGVFGLVQEHQTDPTMIFQLAIDKAGIMRGNYYNTITDTTLPVKGGVDKTTQRAAWTVGDNKNTVFETGLLNLTKDQSSALVHFGKDRTEEWLMVRMKGKETKSDQ